MSRRTPRSWFWRVLPKLATVFLPWRSQVLFLAWPVLAVAVAGCATTPAPTSRGEISSRAEHLDSALVGQHRQLGDYTCIPAAVELVLKLLGRVPTDYYDLQREWRDPSAGSFGAFDGRTIAGVRFHQQFYLPRDDQFPFDEFFHSLEKELSAGRYVIISLPVRSRSGWHVFHAWVIHQKLPSGEFRAVSKAPPRTNTTIVIEDVRATVRRMKGTDILTYEIPG